MNNNCQGYDFSMESLHCNKLFHFSSKCANITFFLINFYNKIDVNMS